MSKTEILVEEIVSFGLSSLRQLNDELIEFGGNIDYKVIEENVLRCLQSILKYIEGSKDEINLKQSIKNSNENKLNMLILVLAYTFTDNDNSELSNKLTNSALKETSNKIIVNLSNLKNYQKHLSLLFERDEKEKQVTEWSREFNFTNLYDFYNFNLNKKNMLSKLSRISLKNIIITIKFPDFNENLIDLAFKEIILYIEEYKYENKLIAVKLTKHLIDNCAKTELNMNNRSRFLFDVLNRYLHDKENLELLKELLEASNMLLEVIETKFNIYEHNYKMHSTLFDSILNNCFMSTNTQVKLVYYEIIKIYLKQLGYYSVRHLNKLYQISFECLEHLKSNIELNPNLNLFHQSFDLVELSIDLLPLRMHSHSKDIINYYIKLLYYCSLATEDSSEEPSSEIQVIAERLKRILTKLFSIKKVKEQDLGSFMQLKFIDTNNHFNKYICEITKTSE